MQLRAVTYLCLIFRAGHYKRHSFWKETDSLLLGTALILGWAYGHLEAINSKKMVKHTEIKRFKPSTEVKTYFTSGGGGGGEGVLILDNSASTGSWYLKLSAQKIDWKDTFFAEWSEWEPCSETTQPGCSHTLTAYSLLATKSVNDPALSQL